MVWQWKPSIYNHTSKKQNHEQRRQRCKWISCFAWYSASGCMAFCDKSKEKPNTHPLWNLHILRLRHAQWKCLMIRAHISLEINFMVSHPSYINRWCFCSSIRSVLANSVKIGWTKSAFLSAKDSGTLELWTNGTEISIKFVDFRKCKLFNHKLGNNNSNNWNY